MDHTTRRPSLDEISYRSMRRPSRESVARPASTASILIGSTAFVAAGYWFGAAWLTNPVLGVPVGLYAIVVLYAVMRWGDAIRVERVSRKTGGSLGVLGRRCGAVVAAGLGAIRDMIATRLPRFERVRRVLGDISSDLAQTTGEIASIWRSEYPHESTSPEATPTAGRLSHRSHRRAHGLASGSDRIATTLDRAKDAHDPDRPLRIGFDLPEAYADRLVHDDAAQSDEMVWIEAGDPTRSPGQACRDLDLDAIVRYEGAVGVVRVLTRPGPDQDGAWDDWSKPGRVSYASVFPPRLDPIAVTLGEPGPPTIGRAGLARSVIASASLLRRWARDGEAIDAERAKMALRGMARSLLGALDQGEDGPIVCGAARVSSAAACVWSDFLPAAERVDLLDAVRRELPCEPEITLRLAVACASSFQDDRVGVLLDEASVQLASCDRLASIDPLGFILSELEHGEGSGLTVGRVGAASCLLAAATDPREYPFVRDDLFDDMRYSPWLVGRDQDRAFLMELYWDRTGEACRQRTGASRLAGSGVAA